MTFWSASIKRVKYAFNRDVVFNPPYTSRVQIHRRTMTDPIKRRQEYKDFRFRRRYDHFLRFKLLGAKPEEIINVAKELGFKLNSKDFTRSRNKNKVTPKQRKTLICRLRSFLIGQSRPGQSENCWKNMRPFINRHLVKVESHIPKDESIIFTGSPILPKRIQLHQDHTRI